MTKLRTGFYGEAIGLAQEINNCAAQDRALEKFDLLRLMILACVLSEPEARTLAYLSIGAPESINLREIEWITNPAARAMHTTYDLYNFLPNLHQRKLAQSLEDEDLAKQTPKYLALRDHWSAQLPNIVKDAVYNPLRVLRGHYPDADLSLTPLQLKLLELMGPTP